MTESASGFSAGNGLFIFHTDKTFDPVVSTNGVASPTQRTELELGAEVGIPRAIVLLPALHEVGVSGVFVDVLAVVFFKFAELVRAHDGVFKSILHIDNLTTQAGTNFFTKRLALHKRFHLLLDRQRGVFDRLTVAILRKDQRRAGIELAIGHIKFTVVIGDFLNGVKVILVCGGEGTAQLLKLVTLFGCEESSVNIAEEGAGL